MAGLLGGLTSALFGGGGADDNSAALRELQNIPLPVLKEYYPELYSQVVSMNPGLESAVNLGPSEMAGISTDPAQRQAQLNALNKLQGIGEAGGRDAQFLADQSRLESDVNTNLQGQTGAIQQNLAARGMGGGMSELVQRNLAAQGASNRQAQMGMDAKAQSEQRALQALMQSGQLAGQMQGQDFNQASAKAQAADSISRFNAQNMQNVNNANVGMKNDAQMYNAQNMQNTANQNTGLKNQQQQYNLGLAQQNFDNRMGRATGIAKQYNAIAAGKNAERAADMGFTGGLISAGATAYGANKKQDNQPQNKTQVFNANDFDPEKYKGMA